MYKKSLPMSRYYADSLVIMNNQIILEDNIFMLNARLRLISDLLRLDADPGLFLDKTIDDIDFVDRVLAVIMKYLMDNKMLIEREDELNKLADLEWRFDQLLTGIHGNSDMITGLNLSDNRAKINKIKNNSIERRMAIEKNRAPDRSREGSSVVSSFELTQLLQVI